MKTCQIIFQYDEPARVLTEVLVEKWDVHVISIRALLREYLQERTDDPLTIEMKAFMDRNEFVPDALAEQMIFREIATSQKDNILLLGYPRMVNQFISFSRALEHHNISLKACWNFTSTNPLAALSSRVGVDDEVRNRVMQYVSDRENTINAMKAAGSEKLFHEIEYHHPFHAGTFKETIVKRVNEITGGGR